MSGDERYIQRCLELAQMAKGQTAPNPMVGAVLVYQGHIIGEGYHKRYGDLHAEVAAFNAVAPADRPFIPESTLYVSLEPCAHYGKQPPCAIRIIQEGVRQVVVCNDDPYEAVQGRGYALLQQAGIPVTRGILLESGRWVNRRFFCSVLQQRPYIVLKWAQTKQGFFAPVNRTRHQMSAPLSQQLVHRWRTEESAILVGTHTALNDNPQLNARLWAGKQPLRLVIDRRGVLPGHAHLLDQSQPTWIFTEREEKQDGLNRWLNCRFTPQYMVADMLQHLQTARIQSLIVEGGVHTLQSFIDAGLWDEARIFITPSVLSDGIAAPVLTGSTHSLDMPVDRDLLTVYTNQHSPYPYTPGLAL